MSCFLQILTLLFTLKFLKHVLSYEHVSPSPTTAPTNPQWIDTVHVVFMNHLDVGFNVNDPNGTLGFSHNVVNYYFTHYFPMAVAVGDNCTQLYNVSFTWTTHVWLISMYFDCPPNMQLHCPTQSEMDYIEYGINQGYIRWHAFPFNSQLELYDANMVAFGVQLSHDLSDRFGINQSQVLSQRDVPGMTRSMIPVLKSNNVNGITIGCNGGSAPPAVPKIFNWKDSVSGEMIITMVHPGGYGGIKLEDAVYVDNWNEALILAFKGDNAGPPTVGEAVITYLALAYVLILFLFLLLLFLLCMCMCLKNKNENKNKKNTNDTNNTFK